jgi:hypothetical protein
MQILSEAFPDLMDSKKWFVVIMLCGSPDLGISITQWKCVASMWAMFTFPWLILYGWYSLLLCPLPKETVPWLVYCYSIIPCTMWFPPSSWFGKGDLHVRSSNAPHHMVQENKSPTTSSCKAHIIM